jgi:hypothetical protein
MIQRGADVEELLSGEIAKIREPKLVALIESLKVPSRKEDRPWDYGPPGQTFPCWIFLEHPPSNTAIAYCSEGFGPRCPWGLLFINTHLSIGPDSSWFVTLEETARNCMAWDGEDYVAQ